MITVLIRLMKCENTKGNLKWEFYNMITIYRIIEINNKPPYSQNIKTFMKKYIEKL